MKKNFVHIIVITKQQQQETLENLTITETCFRNSNN